MDGFYGGRQDLTAALGYELDGQTVILFRRKLNGKARIFPSILPPSPPHLALSISHICLVGSGIKAVNGATVRVCNVTSRLE